MATKQTGRVSAAKMLGLVGYEEKTKTFVVDNKIIQENSLSEKDAIELKKKAKKMSFITEGTQYEKV